MGSLGINHTNSHMTTSTNTNTTSTTNTELEPQIEKNFKVSITQINQEYNTLIGVAFENYYTKLFSEQLEHIASFRNENQKNSK
jgi:hypothetical protein